MIPSHAFQIQSSKGVIQTSKVQDKEALKALVAKIKQCGNRKDLQGGRLLHLNATETGCHKNRYVAHTLISMYGKCGNMQDAREVFNSMIEHDVVSWTALIHGYVENGESLAALDMFYSMDCAPNSFTFVSALRACAELATNMDKKTCLKKGVDIHRQAREHGVDKHVFVESTLVEMYSKFGSMRDAQDVFDSMVHRDVVSWTSLILGYVENGESLMALDVFSRMDCAPNSFTFVAALKACASLVDDKKTSLQRGRSIHRQARECGLDNHVFVASSLVDMYSKCRSLRDARYVFDCILHPSVVSWNSLILGYVDNGESLEALNLFAMMGCAPDSFTFVTVVKACASLAAENRLDKKSCVRMGKAIHGQVIQHGLESSVFVSSSLIDMYSKCVRTRDARDVFDSMTQQNVVSWNALILGYVENGKSSTAMEMFFTMDCEPNRITFAAALKTCGNLTASETGQYVHNQIRELGLENDQMVMNCLVDFYGKCGNMVAAEDVFNRMYSRNTVSWNALIGGYSSLGNTSQVFTVVKRMQEAGHKMDDVTFLLILIACTHAGMVEDGERYFDLMLRTGIRPTVEHYTCMVDMLGRANRLQEALSLVISMPFEADTVVWMTLLGACRQWGNVEVGKVAFNALVMNNKNKDEVRAACLLMREICHRLGIRQEEELIETESY